MNTVRKKDQMSYIQIINYWSKYILKVDTKDY